MLPRFMSLIVVFFYLSQIALTAPPNGRKEYDVKDNRNAPKAMAIGYRQNAAGTGHEVVMVGTRFDTKAKPGLSFPRGSNQHGETHYGSSRREFHEESAYHPSDIVKSHGPYHGFDAGGKPVIAYAHQLKPSAQPGTHQSGEQRRVQHVNEHQVHNHLTSRPGIQKIFRQAQKHF